MQLSKSSSLSSALALLLAQGCNESSEGTSFSDSGGGAGISSGASAGAGGVTGLGGATMGAGGIGQAGTLGATGGMDTGGAAGTGMGGAGTAGSETGGAGTGGVSGSSGTAGVMGDDPPPGEYGDREALPEANSEMAVGEVDGLIYVVGGYPASRVTQTTVQVYDPAMDSWELGPPLPMAIHHPVVMGALGKLYSLGGQTDAGDTDLTLVFDPANAGAGWVELEPMPTARGAGAGAVIGDSIYVVGGRPPAGNAFEVYNITSDQWTELDPLPLTFNQRNHLAAAAIGGRVYVAGGRYDGGSFSSPMTASLDIYDPATGWSQGADMLRERGGLNGVAAYGCFYTWGGEGGDIGEPNNVFPDHDVYDPVGNAWTALAPLPTPIHGVSGAVFLNGLIYMPGGGTAQGGSSGSTIFQVYRPAMRCD